MVTDELATWRKMLDRAGFEWSAVVAIAPDYEALDVEFYDGYGGAEGPPFTIWTADRVWFPVVYDGSESVASVARHPDGQPTRHVGDE